MYTKDDTEGIESKRAGSLDPTLNADPWLYWDITKTGNGRSGILDDGNILVTCIGDNTS